jgi:predicted phage baseplate assembly protein
MSLTSQQSPCGCAVDPKDFVPAEIRSEPGLSALIYRVGTHGAFKQAMIGSLSSIAGTNALSTREDDDPAIAFIDAWATALDVLTFYQERIANEGFLRTAIERESLMQLAETIGYQTGPGVAAGTFLVFSMEDAFGSAEQATIDIGVKAQSVPGQNELPQTFETIEQVEIFRAWNALRPRTTHLLLPPQFGQTVFYLKGISTELKKGDPILIVGDERTGFQGSENWDFRKVASAEIDPVNNWTVVTVDRGLGSEQPLVNPAKKNAKFYALRQRAALFGNNAPDWRLMPDEVRRRYLPKGQPDDPNSEDWPNFTISAVAGEPDALQLDQPYSKILPGSWLVLYSPTYSELYLVEQAAEDARSMFALSTKTTRVKVKGENLNKFENELREALVAAQSELLDWSVQPFTSDITGNFIDLDRIIEGLPKGRVLIVSGTVKTIGVEASEVVTLDSTSTVGGVTRLTLTTNLKHTYMRSSVVICANVVRATHGDTKTEILGSGNSSIPFQRFALSHKPLTYVSAKTPSGGASTLEIRVDDILWSEVPTLYAAGPQDRVYITRISDTGGVTVQFGDGKTGARVPTGTSNVTAKYRVGTGIEGMVDRGQISLLMTRPLGVKGVVNPLAPDGAGDPETRDEVRQNAPLTVLTLDRIVSLQDYEDFARAFAGIGKAKATGLAESENTIVHLTIASATGEEVLETSDLFVNLSGAIDDSRDPAARVRIASFTPQTFGVKARVLVDQPAFLPDKVLAEVKEALIAAYSFERRQFAQPVSESEVASVIQRIRGVAAVQLTALYTGTNATMTSILAARPAHWEKAGAIAVLKPAELLAIDPARIELTEMKKP